MDKLRAGQECWVREAVFLCRTEDIVVGFYFWNNAAREVGKKLSARQVD